MELGQGWGGDSWFGSGQHWELARPVPAETYDAQVPAEDDPDCSVSRQVMLSWEG